MTVRIAHVVVSHGGMADQLVASARRILADREDRVLIALSFDWGSSQDDIRREVAALRDELPEHDAVLFLVDLVGGTPWNALQEAVEEESSVAMIGGVNLPMLLRLCCGSACEDVSLEGVVDWCVGKGRDGIRSLVGASSTEEMPVDEPPRETAATSRR